MKSRCGDCVSQLQVSSNCTCSHTIPMSVEITSNAHLATVEVIVWVAAVLY
jgi:hypothetical protein